MHIGRRLAAGAGFAALFAVSLPLFASDGEWPPLADPQWDGTQVINDPQPPGTPGGFNTHLWMDRVELTIPAPYDAWLTHWHGNTPATGSCPGTYGGFRTDFAIGDVDNDGLADDIVITQPGEAVYAAEMQIDWVTMTGTLNTLGFWLSPYATTVMGGTPNHGGVFSCEGTHRNNPLIWNVADDLPDVTNEIVVTALDASDQERLYVLRYVPGVGLTQLDESPASLSFQVEHRLGVCKVRGTAFPRDVAATVHGEGYVFVWSWENGALTHKYEAVVWTNPEILAKQHAGNWGDVDGDGFDEFCSNGIVDFVDAGPGGVPVPTNPAAPQKGHALWQIMDATTSGIGAHCDKILLADWDPDRPGLEVYAVTETGSGGVWVEAQTGVQHSQPLDTLWDADCGTLIDEWTSAPAQDGQTLYAGNWTDSFAGIEAICSPKDLAGAGGGGSQVLPPGQTQMDGSYVASVRVTPSTTDDDFNLLAIDGTVYNGPSWFDLSNGLKIRSGGPWRNMQGMDWDGDYRTDEILHHTLNRGAVALYRLEDKQDLVPGAFPPGVPTLAQVTTPVPIQNGLDDPSCADGLFGWWYFFFQGDCGEHMPGSPGGDWTWANGGPGRGTHVFQKLAEAYPGAGQWGGVVAHPYDVGGSPDHREEVVAIEVDSPTVHVFANTAPLAATAFPRPSPHGSLEYRRYRQTQVVHPFSFQEMAVAVDRFEARTAGAAVPDRVAGVPFGGSVQLQAFLVFTDGSELDVSSQVTWVQDADSAPYLGLSPAGLVTEAGGVTLSGRFQARMTIEGALRTSDPTYVFTSGSDDPQILRAGFRDSWIVNDPLQDDRPLVIEAWVGQRDNARATVLGLELAGTVWPGVSLLDNGQGEDLVAGDGIYTDVVTSQAGLAPGDNLKVLRAFLPPLSISQPGGIVGGAASSPPWPYLPLGTAGPPPWTDTPAPPPIVTEAVSYEAPRVESLGYRGWGVTAEMLLEAQVVASPFHPAAALLCYAYVPGLGYLAMQDQGDGLFSLKLSTGTAPPGLYLSHVYAVAVDGTGIYASDAYPKIALHGFPSWDTDQPADLDPFCTELEPSNW